MRRKDKVIRAGPSVVAAVTLTAPLPQHGDGVDTHGSVGSVLAWHTRGVDI